MTHIMSGVKVGQLGHSKCPRLRYQSENILVIFGPSPLFRENSKTAFICYTPLKMWVTGAVQIAVEKAAMVVHFSRIGDCCQGGRQSFLRHIAFTVANCSRLGK